MKSLNALYRPNDFNDVLGHKAIIKILSKQVEISEYSNCYLFCGPSGCGKTTLARIFANKINKNQGNPIEVDGASNNGVDNVRVIIDSANERSLDSEYKIFIIDECFVGDTLIYTSDGSKKIKDIKPGDKVMTLEGFNEVSYVHHKPVGNSRLNLLTLTNGEKIVVTADHLFLTTEGWVESKNLKEGDILLDGKNMLELWKDFPDKTQKTEILQQQMSAGISKKSLSKAFNREDLSYLWENLLRGKSRRSKENLFSGMQEQIDIAIRKDYNELRIWDGAKETIIYKIDSSQSNEESTEYRENALNERIEWDSSSTDFEERGEWLIYRTSANAMEGIRRFMEIGIPNKDQLLFKQSKPVSYIIQSRPWLSRDKISNRGGWQKPQVEKWYCERYKENHLFNSVRVKSVEVYKPGNNGKSGESFSGDTELFDLTVKNSPTYFANGVLVHNCHMITTQGWNAFLKCIEEPPQYTIFIFCTTDPQKLPKTIPNRCQVFNLCKISIFDITNRLETICTNNRFLFNRDALELIAMYSNGNLRQAITYLDKCKDYGDITEGNVDEVLNLVGYRDLFRFINDIIDKNPEIMSLIDLISSKVDLNYFINELLNFTIELTKFCMFKDISKTNLPEYLLEDSKYATGVFQTQEENISFFKDLTEKILNIKLEMKKSGSEYDLIFKAMILSLIR